MSELYSKPWVGRIGRFALRCVRAIPIFGYLVDCTKKQHADAFKEFFFGVIFSTSTFWLSAIILLSLQRNNDATYLAMLRSTVNSGELFIFSVGFMGPIVLTAMDDPGNARPFPGRAWHAACLLLLSVVAVAFFALIKVAATEQLVPLFNYKFLVSASMWLAALAMTLRYLTIVYRKQTLANPEKQMKAPELDFTARFVASHGGERDQ